MHQSRETDGQKHLELVHIQWRRIRQTERELIASDGTIYSMLTAWMAVPVLPPPGAEQLDLYRSKNTVVASFHINLINHNE